MTRFLLALLAVLTGLAAAGQPVSARVCTESASAAPASGTAQTAQSCAVAVRLSAPPAAIGEGDRANAGLSRDGATVWVPTVRIVSDRARE